MRKPPNYVFTFVEINETEYDNVKVYFDASPPEPDVGWPGDFQIESVIAFDGTDLLPSIDDATLDDLTQRVQEAAFPDPCEEH